MLLPIVTIACVFGLVFFEWRDSIAGVWVFKPLASAGFVATAVNSGALQSTFGKWILTALVMGAMGDIFLIPLFSQKSFKAGAVFFLLGHLAYMAAFFTFGIYPFYTISAALILFPVGALVLRQVIPQTAVGLRTIVICYSIALVSMVSCAAGTVRPEFRLLFISGFAFMASELSVARDRLIKRHFMSRFWGLPLYYAAQLGFALAAGATLSI